MGVSRLEWADLWARVESPVRAMQWCVRCGGPCNAVVERGGGCADLSGSGLPTAMRKSCCMREPAHEALQAVHDVRGLAEDVVALLLEL